MVSRIGSTHRLDAQTEDVSAFQNSTHTQAIPEINHRIFNFPFQNRGIHQFPQSQIQASSNWFGDGNWVSWSRLRDREVRIIQNNHRIFQLSGTHEVFFAEVGLIVLLRACTRSASRVEWRRIPPHDSSWSFYLHAPGLTFVTLGTACVPSTCIPFACFPFPKLRINRNAHVSF
jgi:hypothetical protein